MTYLVRLLFDGSRKPTSVTIADATDAKDAERQAIERYPYAQVVVLAVIPAPRALA